MENAVHIKNGVLAVIAMVGSTVAQRMGGWDGLLELLVVFMVCDYALGVLIAILKKSPKSESGGLSSKAGFTGLIRKAMILMAVWVAAEFDRSLGVDWARTTMVLFWIGNEGLSLIENSAILGFPWPDAMKDVLEAMKKQGNSGKKAVDSAVDKISGGGGQSHE